MMIFMSACPIDAPSPPACPRRPPGRKAGAAGAAAAPLAAA
jgi:hypothetical protein